MALVLDGFGSLCALAFSEDDRTLVAGHSEAVAVFDVAKGRKLRALEGSHHGHGVRDLVVRDGGVYGLASGHWGIVRWDLATGRYHGKIVGEDEGAGFALSADGATLWVARGRKLEAFDTGAGVALFDPKRRRATRSIAAVKAGALGGVAVAEDGALLFWGDRAWGLARDGKVTATRAEEGRAGGFLADGRAFVLCGALVRVVDARSAKDVAKLDVKEPVWMAATNGHRIFVVTHTKVVALEWDGAALRRAKDVACADVSGIACTKDGARAVVSVMEDERTPLRVIELGGAAAAISAPPKKKAARKEKAAPALSKNPPKWGVPEEQWTAEDHLDFREYVANEHLVGGMPIVELERNHDIPISRVRKWIKTYAEGGREALAASLGALKSYR